MVYPTQYSKIVIEVKYCACPTSELNEWVIFVGKKSNYRLSQNCLRDRRTLGMFFFSTFLLLSHVILPVSPVPLSPSPSFHGLPSVPFLLCYTLLCFIPVRITFSCPSFLSSTFFSFLPLYYHSVRPSYVSFSFDCFIIFFVSFDISCYKCYLIFY
jgi:hypothetical protein